MSKKLCTTALISLAWAVFLVDPSACSFRLRTKRRVRRRSPASVAPPNDFQVFVEKQVFTVNEKTTVGQLKDLVRSKLHYPPDFQKLLRNGTQLQNDNYTMGQLNIGKDCNLRLTGGLDGGVAYGAFHQNWTRYDFVGKLVAKYHVPDGIFGCWLKLKGGTCTALVQGDYALTAAHCFKGRKDYEITDPTKWLLYTTNDLFELDVAVRHPKHNPETNAYDIAYVRLKGRHNNSRHVFLDGSDVPHETRVQMAGFGVDENGECGKFGVGQDFTTRQCDPMLEKVRPDFVCAHTPGHSRTSTAGGDSGAPWWREEDSHSGNGSHRVFGIQAFGYGGPAGSTTKESGITPLSNPEVKGFIQKCTPFQWLENLQTSSSSSSHQPAVLEPGWVKPWDCL